MGRAMVDLYCESYSKVPKRIVLDIDDTFDAVHGGQQLRLFNAHYDEYGFQPIVVFDGEGRFITAVLRPARRPGGKEIKAFLRRLLRAIRANWPRTEILVRGDSHYCAPEVLDFCRANGLDYILGVAPTSTLRRHIEGLEAATKTLYEAAPKDGKARRFKEFYAGATSWSRVERVIARVEVGSQGPDARFVVTNLQQRNARRLTRGRESPRADRPIGDMARDHKAGGQVEPHAARMGELLPSRDRQQGVSGARQLRSHAVAPVVALQAQSQAEQGRELSTLATLRAIRARTPEPAWARRAVDEGVRSCPRAWCGRSARHVR